MDLGHYGWAIDVAPDGRHLVTAGEIEELGFGTLWVNGGQLDHLGRLDELLSATRRVMVAPAVVVAGEFDAEDVGACFTRAESTAPGRLLVGVGPPRGDDSTRRLGEFVDRLDAVVPAERRVLAAFGPRRLNLARHRFAGAVPMAMTPDACTATRRLLGPDRLLVMGQFVVLDPDPVRARDAARVPLRFLTTMPSYRKSLARQGFSASDIDGLSDRLVDGVVAWGTPETVASRLEEQRQAGADHVYAVALNTVDGLGQGDAARALAAALYR